jgi:hypothetical protein
VDIKLHGIGFTRKQVQFESKDLNWDGGCASLIDLVPSVLDLIKDSHRSDAKIILINLNRLIQDMEYSHDIVKVFCELSLVLNRSEIC